MAEEISIKKRLAAGQSILESVTGSLKARKEKAEKEAAKKAKETKEFFTTTKGFKKGIAKTLFSGDSLISSYFRGKLDPKKLDSDKKTTPTKIAAEKISSMAKDVDTIRQAVSALLNFERESKEQGEREKQAAFLEQQDAKEAELEASRVQPTTPTPATATVQASEESGGGMMSGISNIFSNVFGFLKDGLLKAFKFIFKPSNLLKTLGKVFIIGTIIISLFKGIMAGFDRWKETGSISEAIIAGLGAVVDFLSFGLLGEDTVRGVFDTVGGWIAKLKDTIVDTFYDVKDWIVNNIGIPQFTLPMWAVAPPIALINKGAELIGKEAPFPKEITIGPFYPFKDNKTSATSEYSERPVSNEMSNQMQDVSSEMTMPEGKDITFDDLSTMAESKVQNLGMQMKEALPDTKELSPEKMSDMMTGKFGGKQMDMGNMLGPLVEKYGGTEAAESFKKDQGALNKELESGVVDKAITEMGEKSSTVPQAIDQGISSLSEKIKSGGVETGPAMPNLGQQLGESSADVESGQRMESTPDMGNIFNAPSTTNNTGSTGKKKLPPADVFNSDFANVLMRT